MSIVFCSTHFDRYPHRQGELQRGALVASKQLALYTRELYRDEQIAAQLTTEGFHSARSQQVRPDTVMKIRLKHKWYLPIERIRRGGTLEGYLTMHQLADRLNVPYRRAYSLIYQDIIPPDELLHDPVYMIRDGGELLQYLEAYVRERKWKRKTATPLETSSLREAETGVGQDPSGSGLGRQGRRSGLLGSLSDLGGIDDSPCQSPERKPPGMGTQAAGLSQTAHHRRDRLSASYKRRSKSVFPADSASL